MARSKTPLMKPYVGKEELNAIQKVLDSGWMTEGPITKKFEENFAAYVGAKHGIATTSCTTALELALRVLDVGFGDEVVVPDFTHPITAGVAVLVKAKPVLVDVNLESRNVTADHIEEAITKRTKCIIPVSEFGNPLKSEVYKIGEVHDIPVVEDAACSAGAEIDGKKVGTLADMTCFSFHPRKVITTGEGGMITTDNDEFAKRLRSLKKFGMEKGQFKRWGTNYKMSDVLGAIGLAQLEKIEDIIKMRIEKAKKYDELLAGIDGAKPPAVRKGTRHTFQSYAVYIEKDGMRDKLREHLAKRGIETQIGTYALHLQPCFASVEKRGSLENSERLFKNLLTLPLYHELSAEDQERVCSMISEFLG